LQVNQPICSPFGEKAFIMDTKSLDKQDKAHLQIYQNFMFAAKISVIAIIATLVIMAATLI
jgi:hypothetical protein